MIRLEIFSKRARRLAALAIAAGVACSGGVKQAGAAMITENFDTDPGWISRDVLNTSSLNNYGYQPTSNFADGANAGEAGGIVDRRKAVGPPRGTYYATPLYSDGLDGSTAMSATGRFGWDEIEGATARDNGEWSLGWFSDWNSPNQFLPTSGIVMFYSSRNHFIGIFRPGADDGGGLRRDTVLLPDPKVPSIDGCIGNESTVCTGAPGGKDFSIQYDPNANGGLGAVSVLVTDPDSVVTHSATLNLTAAERAALGSVPLNRFGILAQHAQALDDPSGSTRATRVWIDDLEFEAGVPEPSSLLLLGLGAVFALPVRMRQWR